MKKRKKKPAGIDVIVRFNQEEGILFETEFLSFVRDYNVDITAGEFMKKVFRDYLVRKRKYRRKRLPKYNFKEH